MNSSVMDLDKYSEFPQGSNLFKRANLQNSDIPLVLGDLSYYPSEKTTQPRSHSKKTQSRSSLSGYDLLPLKYKETKISSKTDISSRNLAENLITDYFLSSPYKRVYLRKIYASKVTRASEMFSILEWGTKRGIKEAYDGAVALIAECDINVLTEAIEKVRQSLVYDPIKSQRNDDLYEILITGVACADKIPSARKLNLLQSLFTKHLSRTLKTALIDAFRILEGEVDSDLIKIYLERFISSHEPDEYVRNYAQEALDDLY